MLIRKRCYLGGVSHRLSHSGHGRFTFEQVADIGLQRLVLLTSTLLQDVEALGRYITNVNDAHDLMLASR